MFGDIANSEGERLDYSFHEGSAGSRDVVVIGHGVTGNKDRPFVIALQQRVGRCWNQRPALLLCR